MASTNGAAMTPRQARAALPRLAGRIVTTNEKLDALYAQRLEAWQVLTAAGITQAEMAELAQVTPMMVAYALHMARKKAAAGG